ncbi:MAG: endonuclease domain-containing protein [Dehalococcoidales bacterium]|nr:endonuclease domain-containing protein [Dehalococcoidales bacterium]
MLSYKEKLKKPSRQLRHDMTDTERYLWSKLKMRQLNGYQFYRQKPIGNYIVDFYCPALKLVIEVDGSQHFYNDGLEHDKERDAYINSLGLKVLRFTNVEVLKNMQGVFDKIIEHMNEIPLVPPFPKWENKSSFKGKQITKINRKEKLINRGDNSLINKEKGKP